METRAPYALIGAFVIAIMGAVFGFVYWLHNTGGLGERTIYRVRFENTVSGLLTGAAVLFNGIRVGEVIDLRLDPDDPKQVSATITIVASTPVRADTQVGLEFQGLTGVPVISLQGGATGAARLMSSNGDPPTLVAAPMAGQSMTEAARQALRRLDSVLADNSDTLKNAIANLNTFAGALARNSDRVDGILSGLERMTAGTPAKPTPALYDLTAPRTFQASDRPAQAQIVIPEPTAVLAFDTPRIIVAPGAGESSSVDVAQWRDNIPKLFQAKLIESFENSNYVAAVARPLEGLNADYQLLIDIRNFQISPAQVSPATTDSMPPAAHVEFAAKILGENGRIIGSRTFEAVVLEREPSASGAARAIDAAFGKAATDLVVWTRSVI